MGEAKLAPNLPDWMVAHANRYIASGGTEGHMYKINVPGRDPDLARLCPGILVPSRDIRSWST
jgi:hypothetical protein